LSAAQSPARSRRRRSRCCGRGYGHRVNLALFFQVTAIFLMVFVAQLLIYGFHELTEANLFPNSEALHWATEPYGPDGVYGQYLTYMLVAMPLGWLLFSMVAGPNRATSARARRLRAAPLIETLDRG
jgi:hypothetical protein